MTKSTLYDEVQRMDASVACLDRILEYIKCCQGGLQKDRILLRSRVKHREYTIFNQPKVQDYIPKSPS